MKKDIVINQIDENGKRHGLWERYHDNGQLWFKGEYKNGKRHGPWEHCYGQLWSKGKFKSGKQTGLWYEKRYSY